MTIELNLAQTILLFIILGINLAAFIYMGIDKAKAINSSKTRIPEVRLLFLAICFCAIGVFAGMIIFRHKIRTFYFYTGIPVAIIENISLFYMINNFIS